MSWAFVCSSEVLDAGFLDYSRLVCWFGWEGADGEGVAMSSVVVRRIWGTLVGERLANAVSAGNDDPRLMIETSQAGCLLYVQVADCLSMSDGEHSTAVTVVFMPNRSLAS